MKTYRQIEESRNLRLWITQVGIPVATLAVTTMTVIPEAREALVNGVKKVGKGVSKIMKKKEKTVKKQEIRDDFHRSCVMFENIATGEYRGVKINERP